MGSKGLPVWVGLMFLKGFQYNSKGIESSHTGFKGTKIELSLLRRVLAQRVTGNFILFIYLNFFFADKTYFGTNSYFLFN